MKSRRRNRQNQARKVRKGCNDTNVVDLDVMRRRAFVEAWKQRIMAQALNRGYRHAA